MINPLRVALILQELLLSPTQRFSELLIRLVVVKFVSYVLSVDEQLHSIAHGQQPQSAKVID